MAKGLGDPLDEAPVLDFQTKSDKIKFKHFLDARAQRSFQRDEVPAELNPLTKNEREIITNTVQIIDPGPALVRKALQREGQIVRAMRATKAVHCSKWDQNSPKKTAVAP